MEQIYDANDDEEFVYKSSNYLDKALELSNLEQGYKSVEDYKEKSRRRSKYLEGKRGNVFMGN